MTNDDEPQTTHHQLSISVEAIHPGHAVLTLAGRFDAVEAMRVRERLSGTDLVDARRLVVDLTDVTFVDSAGLAALARARRDRVLTDGSLTVVRPASEDAMRVFRLTQFDEIFTMVHTREGG